MSADRSVTWRATHTWEEGTDAAPLPPPPEQSLADRYEDRGPLAEGGMGEIRRAWDRHLGRPAVLKLLRADRADHALVQQRFLQEAQITARLQHPGVVPVHALGRGPDGRWCFAMPEIHGQPMSALIAEVHTASSRSGWEAAPSGWTFRRLLHALVSAAEAVAFAHGQGIVHRDIKPQNVLLGPYGEVFVLDWGLAQALPVAGGELRAEIAGTPAYMAPEQASGAPLHVLSDVYALGSTLYHLLCGCPPYDGRAALAELQQGPPVPLGRRMCPPLPAELVETCQAAMARAPQDRPPTALAFADALRAWLDGERQREQALAVVAQAQEREAVAALIEAEAEAARAEGQRQLDLLPAWAAEADKAPLWERMDDADALLRHAGALRLEAEGLYLGALATRPELIEAHVALATRARDAHRAAEARRDAVSASSAEAQLRHHAEALPQGHPARAAHRRYLAAEGRLTLWTDPPGAEVWVERYTPHRRRLVPVTEGRLGITPLLDVPMAMGSFRLRLRAPGCAETLYPVWIRREGCWDGVPPEGGDPGVIRLPRLGELGPDDTYVPPGWFAWGGDPAAAGAAAARQVWLDGFVLRRNMVTQAEVLAWLNALVASGRRAEALALAPRERGGAQREEGALVYGQAEDGTFYLRPDPEGDPWDPRWPANYLTLAAAQAYAAWEAARTGLPWRLPFEAEREKATRGVDGRLRAWGDAFDASWCNCRLSRPDRPMPAPVGSFPVDEGPYGARDLMGNAIEWTASAWSTTGEIGPDGRPANPTVDPQDASLSAVLRGGSWASDPTLMRAAYRSRWSPTATSPWLGFRLARGFGEV